MRWASIFGMLAMVPALGAQEKSPSVVTLKLHPAAALAPALKYTLLPSVRELKPGNAAVFYHRVHSPLWFQALEREPSFAKLHDWLEMSPTQMPEKEVRQFLSGTAIFQELDHAARCETCDWQLTSRLRDEGINLALPEAQSFRQLALLLAVKARMEVFDGRPAQALRVLQTGIAMGRHVGDCPVVLNALIGMGIEQTMLGDIEDFVQRPGFPNLYWALRDLPDPLIDLRRPLQGDRLAVDAWWPEIRKALEEPKFQPLPLATLRASVDKVFGLGRTDSRITVAQAVTVAHPQAMAYFLKKGHSREELDALPVTQVVLMYSLAEWDRWHDAVYRWHNVPYWQARSGLKKAVDEREQALRENKEVAFFYQHLLPTNEGVFFTRARLQRRIAALQCIEAIRMYAAANNGQLPDALADIHAVPIPIDPVTGKSFSYRSGGAVARLQGPAPPGEAETERNTLVYQISIVK
jgi:hypothetical protein